LFFNEQAAYGETPTETLYSTYWSQYVELLYNPRTRLLNASAIIPLADYFQMELNDIVEWRGNYYHLRAINDYNLSNGECNIQLLGPVIGDVISNILPVNECNFDFSVTTGIQIYCVCENVRFTNNHSRLYGSLEYTPCGTTSSVSTYVNPRSTLTVCLATEPGFGYPAATDFFYTNLGSCTAAACPSTSMPITITLTEKIKKAGPDFEVYYSDDCNNYIYAETIQLANIGASVNITVPNTSSCIKLVSLGDCGNSVVHVIPGALGGDFNIDFSFADFNVF
jgi:hypothetical protein